MYCEKCKHQSPDNFTSCAYCGEKLTLEKPKENKKPSVFSKLTFLNKKSFAVFLTVVFSAVTLICGVWGIIAGKKPQKIAVNMAKAIEEKDEELYYSLFDDEYLEYKKDCFYFSDYELFKGVTEPLHKSDEFYKGECGEDYKLKCEFSSVTELSESEVESVNDYLKDMYGYTHEIKDAAVLSFSVNAKGKKGSYKSDYRNFYCVKIDGRWYSAPEIDIEGE